MSCDENAGAEGEWFGVDQAFLDALAAAVYVCDAEGRVVRYNDAAAALWGRRPEPGQERWCGSWRVYEADGTPVPLERCLMADAVREGRAARGRTIIIERPDGTRRLVVPHPQPIRDAAGRLIGAVNLLVDVTEQREGEQARALLAAIVASSDDAIISKTLDGRITSWNQGAERIFGYTAEEAIGRPITMLIPPERLAEEDRILARLAHGERIDHFQTVRVARDGRRIHVSLAVSPVRDSGGRLIGASKVARDITAQKRAEEALAESEERLRTLLALLPIGVYACDAAGRITYYNRRAAELWGCEPEGTGEGFTERFRIYDPSGALVPPDRTPMARALQGEECCRDVEMILERPDGTRFHASISIDVLRDAQGRVQGAINVFHDVSVQVAARESLKKQRELLEEAVARRTAELEASHQRLRMSERMAALGTLSAGLGHDMGNLLLPVRVSLDALASAPLSDELRDEVERIRTSVRYLQQLANGLRMMVMDPDRAAPSEPLHLGAWWADAQPIVRNALPRQVRLEADVTPDAWVRISRPALTQVVFNLAQNAGEAVRGRQDGRVRLRVAREGDRVLLSVEDNGAGMSEEVRNRCMEPFFTTKTRRISTGLGLVLVAGLVRDAGGTVEIRTQLGLGTEFVVALPAVDPPAERTPTSRGSAVVALADPRLRSIVVSELRHLSYEIVPESHGGPVDLAVVDAGDGARGRAARRVVLFAEGNGDPGHVTAIGARPKPEVIRRALREVTEEGREAAGTTP